MMVWHSWSQPPLDRYRAPRGRPDGPAPPGS